jgi:hypothetical protein
MAGMVVGGPPSTIDVAEREKSSLSMDHSERQPASVGCSMSAAGPYSDPWLRSPRKLTVTVWPGEAIAGVMMSSTGRLANSGDDAADRGRPVVSITDGAGSAALPMVAVVDGATDGEESGLLGIVAEAGTDRSGVEARAAIHTTATKRPKIRVTELRRSQVDFGSPLGTRSQCRDSAPTQFWS